MANDSGMIHSGRTELGEVRPYTHASLHRHERHAAAQADLWAELQRLLGEERQIHAGAYDPAARGPGLDGDGTFRLFPQAIWVDGQVYAVGENGAAALCAAITRALAGGAR